MPRQRNTQFAKFWSAQTAITHFDRELKTAKGMTSYVERACKRAFLLKRYPVLAWGTKVEVIPHYHRERGDAWGIGIPEGKFTITNIAYSLTRVIWQRRANREPGGHEWAYTGWQWAAIYLDVVHALMGKPAADVLKASYAAHGVRWKPKKKVTVTAAMVERLAAARTKREKADA